MQKILLLFLSFLFIQQCINLSNIQKQINKKENYVGDIKYLLLNKGQTIKIPLDKYFQFSNNFSIKWQNNSSDIKQILDYKFKLNKIQVQKSQYMNGTINNNSTVINLNEKRIIDIKTIYNQPNKIFLLQENIIMMYSYRQKQQRNLNQNQNVTIVNISAQLNQLNKSSDIKFTNLNCTNIQILPIYNQFKLVALCRTSQKSPPSTKNYIIGFNMQTNNLGFIINIVLQSFKILQYNSTKQNMSTICNTYGIKYFQKISFENGINSYNKTVIIYCKSKVLNSQNLTQIYPIIYNQKQIDFRVITNNKQLTIYKCLNQSNYISEYQDGFISIVKSNFNKNQQKVMKYSYKRIGNTRDYQTKCQQFISDDVSQYMFATSRNIDGIWSIYIIFQTKILILQSYSPNYQNLTLSKIQNSTLKSYAISNGILSLHYQAIQTELNQNSSKIIIDAYDIKQQIYPQLIERVVLNLPKDSKIFLFSVMNYLEIGNYFFVYQRKTNILNLTYYEGQTLAINVKENSSKNGSKILIISNRSNQKVSNLINQKQNQQYFKQKSLLEKNQDNISDQNISFLRVELIIRSFNDTSVQFRNIPDIIVNNKIFKIQLQQSVIGPLGRFYKINNKFTSLQFVNSFTQIQITELLKKFPGKNLITFSVNTFLKYPIISFYFQNYDVLNCDLQFDASMKAPMIQNCAKYINTDQQQNYTEHIIIYDEGKFIQFIKNNIYFCQITSTIDTICFFVQSQWRDIKKIKLIKYEVLQDKKQFISVFIIFDNQFKQKDYIKFKDGTSKEDFNISENVYITQNQLNLLSFMDIKTIQYDQGYANFLLLYMIHRPLDQKFNYSHQLNDDFQQYIQIYYKPILALNQSSNFIGHLIQEFKNDSIQNVFIISNKILILLIQNGTSQIYQYQVNNFKCQKKRQYPVYDHVIVKNGMHFVTSGFLFVQVYESQVYQPKYLVYNPLMNTTNIITHSFFKDLQGKLLIAQQIKYTNNVMLINGKNLISLSLPNIVIKLKQIGQGLEKTVNLSFIDNQQVWKIISYNFLYDISQSKIQYEDKAKIQLGQGNNIKRLVINPSSIKGPVAQYDLYRDTHKKYHKQNYDPLNENKDPCSFIEVRTEDIFTKTKCLLYYNAKKDGLMQDFILFRNASFNRTFIVTDRKILCVQQNQMIISSSQEKNRTKDCNIFQDDKSKFLYIICNQNDQTTINKIVITDQNNCSFVKLSVKKPQFLKYNLFKMVTTAQYAIFQVPIRYQTNKVYYVCKFYPTNDENNQFSINFFILKNRSQEQFLTKDFATNQTLFFLLQNGLLIYDLSQINIRNISTLTPNIWISQNQLRDSLKIHEQFIYIKFIDRQNCTYSKIRLQIGTKLNSFQTHLKFDLIDGHLKLNNITIKYTYKNPANCYNTLLSKSRFYSNSNQLSIDYNNNTMTIKICQYTPQQYYIFSNFIPITSQSKRNSYLIFFQKSSNKNYSQPFRMDIIYTNIYSNDNFQIQNGKLIIGSLFNLFCEYDLREAYTFVFTFNEQKFKNVLRLQQNQHQIMDLFDQNDQLKCYYRLNLSNQNFNITPQVQVTIKINQGQNNSIIWEKWIQRIIILLIVLNYIRLYCKQRDQIMRKNPKSKIKMQRSDSFDHQFQVQVRFLTKKYL